MLGNWIKCTTTTTGTGTLTLSSVTGYPTVGDWFSDGDVVAYALLDSSGLPIESGIGTYTASGTTLARSIVQATMVSGTLTKVGATAVSLTGTTTVIISQIAGVSVPGLSRIVDVRGQGQLVPAWSMSCDSYSSLTVTANRLLLSEYTHRSSRPISGFKIYCSSVTGNLRIGLYAVKTDGTLGKLVADTGSKTILSGVAEYALSASVWLPPDIYALAFICDNATTTFRTTNSSYGVSIFGADTSGYPCISAYTSPGSFTLPDPFSGTLSAGQLIPAVFVVLG